MKTPTPEEFLKNNAIRFDNLRIKLILSNLDVNVCEAMQEYAEAYHKEELEKFTKKNKI